MKVTFNINFHTVWGQRICIVGSTKELGLWEPTLAKEMHYIGDGNWQLQLEISPETSYIEYRYFLCINEKQIFEEWEKNHRIDFTDNKQQYTLYDHWQIRPANHSFYTSAFTKSWFAHPCSGNEQTVNSHRKIIIQVFAPQIEKNQTVAISGNQNYLGNWNPDHALTLHCPYAPLWSIELDANRISFPLEYKFLIRTNNAPQTVQWEEEANRVFNPSVQQSNETIVISGLYFRDKQFDWKCTGTVIPLFSLRSEKSFGIGDFSDLHLLIDWVKKTDQRLIQILPINDTTMTHSWRDSYPYSAISIYALHPIYISLHGLGKLDNTDKMRRYAAKQLELNAKANVDYEAVLTCKMDYCRDFFKQQGTEILHTEAFQSFFADNETWLIPYASYCYLRDMYGTSDFDHWGKYSSYNPNQIHQLCRPEHEAWPEISFYIFLQYILHIQFKTVSDYARSQGVVLKGDLPIGVNRTSIEVWTEPKYFNLDSQSGAPPDDFSLIGQNWGFPTYNWDKMEKNHFAWWKKRFHKLSDYFDCFRIDHILGFFRIWEIPTDYIQGLCGHFYPALPLSRDEIEQYGFPFDEVRFTTPHINRTFLAELFGEYTQEVEGTYLIQSSSHHMVLKPFCETQHQITDLFAGKTDEKSMIIKNGLYAIANEVLFLHDPRDQSKFHPRISASSSYIYKELSATERYAFDQLYWDFFYHRHNEFWKTQAYKRLIPLMNSTEMLVCGEDLGMIPQSVPEVMNKLQILSLEIERMPKTSEREFTDLQHLPYLSVCTTSTHDMSPIRNWWKEDRHKTQRYYTDILGYSGDAPGECTAELATQIIHNHLMSNSMLTIIPMQDWFAIDDSIKQQDISSERINIPADPMHYWRYRMHISLEKLIQADEFNNKIKALIHQTERK
ncbi:4-alpha-glucanotransferase [Parabacteroides sp. PF5-9]|uniref:4-alpha-glucanotransferase n=1 Tax=Parabacteroides sp. PF5-9 TaxID=1742404 RepID=UPI002476FB3F|nr:4-alpha-glucanotransferase [Parabacteroides sp. PF5-9]MDH6358266.1 4-alpha-glucanotransferase [Parabacteroides sp. PF5-9]